MTRFRFWIRLACAAAVGGAVLMVTAVADAGANATLTMQVLPGLLAPGGSGAVVATFTNNGPSTLTHVIVNVTLPAGATFDSTNSSASCTGPAPFVSCSLGMLKKGNVIVSTIAFGSAPSTGPVTFDGKATWDAASVGNPQGAAGSKDTVSATGQADVISLPSGFAGTSSCHATGDTLFATANGQSTQVVAGVNDAGLPCTPILAGVTQGPGGDVVTDVSFVKLPHLVHPATVVLTFPDETLPWPTDLGSPPDGRDSSAPTQLVRVSELPEPGRTNSGARVPQPQHLADHPVGLRLVHRLCRRVERSRRGLRRRHADAARARQRYRRPRLRRLGDGAGGVRLRLARRPPAQFRK